MPNIELTHISVAVKLAIGEPRRNNPQFYSLSQPETSLCQQGPVREIFKDIP